jgi:multidrug resistance protein, MATE family
MSLSTSGHGPLARLLISNTWPVLGAQLSSISMMLADTLIAGHHSTEALAAVAVGGGWYISVVMLLVGTLQSIAPIVAHHRGARRPEQIAPAFQQGLWLALGLCVPGLALLWSAPWFFALLGIPPDTADLAEKYTFIMSLGLPAVLCYRSFHAFANAMEHPRVLLWITLTGAVLHVPMAFVFTHGLAGWPGLGAVGCALSSVLVAWMALVWAVFHIRHAAHYQPFSLFRTFQKPIWAEQRQMLRLGVPMGFSSFIEISSFTLIALLIARLGPEVVAGHRVVANLAAVLYMLPLALSIALLVQIGQHAGAHDRTSLLHVLGVGLVLGSVLATVAGLVCWVFRAEILALMTQEAAVADLAKGLMLYVCLYQFFDAVQTVFAHALRGLKITFVPMLLHSLCFWGVGLLGGYWATYHAPWHAQGADVAGFWQALLASTFVASLCFGALLFKVLAVFQERGKKDALL